MIRKTSIFNIHEHKYFIAVVLLCFLILSQLAAAADPVPVGNIKHLFSLKVNADIPLSLPSDVAVDDDGNIYIVDSGNQRIAVFDEDGDDITSFPEKEHKQAQLKNPVGIDFANDNIYVADKDNHRIRIFDKNGTYKKSIRIRDGKKKIRPVDIAVNKKSKLIYVSGNNNHKLMVYSLAGKLLRQWGLEGTNRGEFRYPATISLYRNNAYVVDILNSRVQIFNPKGELQAIAGEWGVLPGQLFRPKGVALDTKGNIYISDSYLNVIQVFSNDTRFRYVLGKEKSPHRFTTPAGITVDRQNRLYVCEMLDNKVSVFALEP